MIKLDNDGYCTVVITCAGCPWWSAIRLDMAEGHACAVTHEKVHHPESKQAREAARKWRRAQQRKLTATR
ncbi:hypothetical protein [Leucobacter chironomi]|uniref:hypothetical protein n=1 Tax=Leucobacter chironomi TaxID=491918 RepID=UPI001268C0B4|nr:hypothetical protein [Leucobacter chironomi]